MFTTFEIYLLFSSPWVDQAQRWGRRRVGDCGNLTASVGGEEAFVERPDCGAEEEEGNEGRWADFCLISEAAEIHVRCTSLHCPSKCCDSVWETSLRIDVAGQEEVCSWRMFPYWNPWEEEEDLWVRSGHHVDWYLQSRKVARHSRGLGSWVCLQHGDFQEVKLECPGIQCRGRPRFQGPGRSLPCSQTLRAGSRWHRQ